MTDPKPSKDELAYAMKEFPNLPHPEMLPIKFKGEAKIKVGVLEKLALRKRGEATEDIVKEILKKNRIYSIRSDEKQEMWIYDKGIYIPQGRSYCKEVVRHILGDVFTNSLASDVIAKIEVDTFIDPDKFFQVSDVNVIAVKNGLLNLKTKKISLFSDQKIFFNQIPVEYDLKAKCPAIEKFFKEILEHEKDVSVIEELFGFLLWKEHFMEKGFMFNGEGRNGKSKLTELMKRFLGVRNCTNISLVQLEKETFALAGLLHKMANLSPDISSSALKHSGVFKAITGRDHLSAPRKFLSNVEFVNYSKQVFCCNDLPKPHDTSMAFWSRWILFKFPFTFLSQKELDALAEGERENVKLADPDIISKITTDEELSGLLNLALSGLKRLHKQGDFSYSKNTAEVKEMWIRKADSFSAFLQDECEEDFDSYISKIHLNKAYTKYCRTHKVKVMGLRSTKTTLEERGIDSRRLGDASSREYVWDGIKFKDKLIDVSRIKDMDLENYPEGVSTKAPASPKPEKKKKV